MNLFKEASKSRPSPSLWSNLKDTYKTDEDVNKELLASSLSDFDVWWSEFSRTYRWMVEYSSSSYSSSTAGASTGAKTVSSSCSRWKKIVTMVTIMNATQLFSLLSLDVAKKQNLKLQTLSKSMLMGDDVSTKHKSANHRCCGCGLVIKTTWWVRAVVDRVGGGKKRRLVFIWNTDTQHV